MTDQAVSLLEALGAVVVYSNQLDQVIADFMWALAAGSGLSYQRVIETIPKELGNAAKRLWQEYKKVITDASLLSKAQAHEARLAAAVDERNEFIHASWANVDSPVVYRERRKKGQPATVMLLRPDQVLAAADRIGDVAEQLWRFWDETTEWMDANGFKREGAVEAIRHVDRSKDP